MDPCSSVIPERARCLIFIALWSARRRGGSYIEPEDLLHALILIAGFLPSARSVSRRRSQRELGREPPVFLFRQCSHEFTSELHEETDPLVRKHEEESEPAPHVDMPVHSLRKSWKLSPKLIRNTKIIEPLDLLAGIVENRDSRLAQRYRITASHASGESTRFWIMTSRL
jgi:hypothetical protein